LAPQTDDLILDVGCNTAEAERFLMREHPQIGKVIGVENHPKRHDYALSKLAKDRNRSQIELRLGDAIALPFREAYFNHAICVDVLE
jgi:ubiquinone/menaquinone biosynthesis C-methylase UbiE